MHSATPLLFVCCERQQAGLCAGQSADDTQRRAVLRGLGHVRDRSQVVTTWLPLTDTQHV
jgi:hypothetical protein